MDRISRDGQHVAFCGAINGITYYFMSVILILGTSFCSFTYSFTDFGAPAAVYFYQEHRFCLDRRILALAVYGPLFALCGSACQDLEKASRTRLRPHEPVKLYPTAINILYGGPAQTYHLPARIVC